MRHCLQHTESKIMEENPPNKISDARSKPSRTLRRVLLPTVLTIAIASIGAAPFNIGGDRWQTVASTSVSLDSKLYHVSDNTTGWVAELGVSPSYFVSYDTPEGKRKFVSLANQTGEPKSLADVASIDRKTHSVRYVLVLKDHRQLPVEEKNGFIVSGTTTADGKTPFKFRALTIPREGVRPNFHPSDVEEIRLQIKRKK